MAPGRLTMLEYPEDPRCSSATFRHVDPPFVLWYSVTAADSALRELHVRGTQ